MKADAKVKICYCRIVDQVETYRIFMTIRLIWRGQFTTMLRDCSVCYDFHLRLKSVQTFRTVYRPFSARFSTMTLESIINLF